MKSTARVTETQWQVWQEEGWSILPYIAEYPLPVGATVIVAEGLGGFVSICLFAGER